MPSAHERSYARAAPGRASVASPTQVPMQVVHPRRLEPGVDDLIGFWARDNYVVPSTSEVRCAATTLPGTGISLPCVGGATRTQIFGWLLAAMRGTLRAGTLSVWRRSVS